jgi:hypothetical protein
MGGNRAPVFNPARWKSRVFHTGAETGASTWWFRIALAKRSGVALCFPPPARLVQLFCYQTSHFNFESRGLWMKFCYRH